jgi:hypothetical protein
VAREWLVVMWMVTEAVAMADHQIIRTSVSIVDDSLTIRVRSKVYVSVWNVG